jgi:gluconate kinase
MQQRVGHYMQPGLLDSQFRALEIPQADETDVIRLPITEPVQDMVAQALAALQARTSSPLHPAL